MNEDKTSFVSFVDRNREGSDSEIYELASLEAVATTIEKQMSLTRSVRELQADKGIKSNS